MGKKNRKDGSNGIMGIRSEQTSFLVQERSPCGVGLLSVLGGNFNITEFILRNETLRDKAKYS